MKAILFKKKRWIKTFFLLSFLLFGAGTIQAQLKTVTGNVTDAATKEALVEVSIVVKGTLNGTLTDVDGNFSLPNVPAGSTIVISYIGYVNQEIVIDNQTSIVVSLAEDKNTLDEVVVIGYGTTTRKNFTGSVSQVNVGDSPLSKIPTSSALDALRGSVPGMVVSQQQGAGQSPSLLVRGQRSLSGGATAPLIVLDGVLFMGEMRDIDPSIIENMSVLKDATSIAVYGSRAANGVIMITTKKGKLGKPVINFNASVAVAQMANKPRVLSPENYIKKVNSLQNLSEDADPLVWMSDFERENYKKGITTDWLDLVSRTGLLQNYSMSISGANEKVNYFLSVAHTNQEGVLKGDDFLRNTFTSRLKSNITDWLEVGADVDFSFSDYSGPTSYDIYQAIRLTPYGKPYRSNGKLEKYPRQEGIYMTNPLWNSQSGTIDDHDTFNSYRLGGHALVKMPWVKGLSYRLNYVTTNEYIERDVFTHEGYYVPEVSATLKDEDRYSPSTIAKYLANANGYSARTRNQSWVMDNIINYTNQLGKHFIDLTYVYTRDSYTTRYKRMDGTNFASLGNTELGYNGLHYAVTQKINSISASTHNNIGYLGRVIYNYDNKYHLTGSVRRDGSSVFGADTKWGVFPSIGAAWTVSSEEFFNGKITNVINYLKLKASWGKNGNQSLSPYSTLSRIALGQAGGMSYPFGNTSSVSWGQRQSTLGNTALGWETTTAVNIGFETSMFTNRIQLEVDGYKSKTTDQIFTRVIPVMGNGITSMPATMGRVDNWGIEVTLTSSNIKTKDFEWTSMLTYYMNRSIIKELYGDGKDDIESGYFLNESIGVIYGYTPIGIVQSTDADYIAANKATLGDVMFANTDNSTDGKITAADRSIRGYSKENFRMALANTVRYKDFELYAMFAGVFGGNNYYKASNLYAYRTASDVVWDNNFDHEWWTPENKSDKYPRVNYTDPKYNPLQSRTFVRLQDISLSYSFRQEWIKKININSLKVFVAAKNLLTITGWEGGDPEIAQTLGSGYSYGYPLAKSISFGVNLTF